MRRLWSNALRFRNLLRQLTPAALGLLLAAPAFAQGASLGRTRSASCSRRSPALSPEAFPWSQSWYLA